MLLPLEILSEALPQLDSPSCVPSTPVTFLSRASCQGFSASTSVPPGTNGTSAISSVFLPEGEFPWSSLELSSHLPIGQGHIMYF